jgi:6-phosphogluconate dehydrogenase
MIGLGRMGANMVRRLMKRGHACVVYDRNAQHTMPLAAEGATGTASLEELVTALETPRVVWVMVPAGPPTEETVTALAERMEAGDILIDGGNSYYKDDVRRAITLQGRGIHYVDVGTSGGLWGLERGYSLMIGGSPAAVERLDPILASLAPGNDGTPATTRRDGRGTTAARGYLHCGPPGAGHFVKMVHNGIEYGLMQAYAEGFRYPQDRRDQPASRGTALRLRSRRHRRGLAAWECGRIVAARLTAMALAEDPELSAFSGFCAGLGRGPLDDRSGHRAGGSSGDVLATSLFAIPFALRTTPSAEKVLSAMRHKFGGHVERPAGRLNEPRLRARGKNKDGIMGVEAPGQGARSAHTGSM